MNMKFCEDIPEYADGDAACKDGRKERVAEMAGKINRICQKLVRYLGILFVGYLFLQGLFTMCCIQRVNERVYFIRNHALPQLAGIVLFFLMTLFLVNSKRCLHFLGKYENALIAGVGILLLVFLAWWIANTRFWYDSDMEKIYQYAGLMLGGDYSGWMKGGYLYMYPHQNGLLLFVAFLLCFLSVDGSFAALYYINVFFYIITIMSLCFCLRTVYADKSARCIQSIMLICFLPYSFFCLMLYGNVIGFGFACAAMAAMFAYLKNAKAGWLGVSALCMAAAIIFKQNELIVFVGLVILLIFECLMSVENRRKKAVLSLVYMAVVLLGVKTPDLIIKGITGIEVEGGSSRFSHLAMGLQYSDEGAPGWYNGFNANVFEAVGYDTEASAEVAKTALRESWTDFMKNPRKAWKFFNAKLASEWNNPTFECFNIQNSRNTGLELSSFVKSTINDGGKVNILLTYLMDVGQSVLLFGILMYLIASDKMDWKELLPLILFIGGMIFFAFWEAKSQYVLPFFLLLVPYAFPGYQKLTEAVKHPKAGHKKLFAGMAVTGALILLIAISDGQWVHDSFKIDKDTEKYYEYIHMYNKNFENLRF
ncbi:MAG: hypothetical protein NC243_05955 [Lachnoclostridium sp.]|nr:hypothetical protein [Lachnoclostridium sp.]MCM1384077.1 hypothetical protein [Lachnoclostridium sp.]